MRVRTSYELHRTVSSIFISHVQPTDSGAYYCDPDGLEHAKVILHVLTGKPVTLHVLNGEQVTLHVPTDKPLTLHVLTGKPFTLPVLTVSQSPCTY